MCFIFISFMIIKLKSMGDRPQTMTSKPPSTNQIMCCADKTLLKRRKVLRLSIAMHRPTILDETMCTRQNHCFARFVEQIHSRLCIVHAPSSGEEGVRCHGRFGVDGGYFARFSRNLLKFATCPYGCLITTLYGRSR